MKLPKDRTQPFKIKGETYYLVEGVQKITKKKTPKTVIRWIHGQNERGIVLKATRQQGMKTRPYIIAEKDFKDFVLKWFNLPS